MTTPKQAAYLADLLANAGYASPTGILRPNAKRLPNAPAKGERLADWLARLTPGQASEIIGVLRR